MPTPQLRGCTLRYLAFHGERSSRREPAPAGTVPNAKASCDSGQSEGAALQLRPPEFIELFDDTLGFPGLPIRGVMTTLRTRRTYDHRIRELICETGDPDPFPELKIPRSTIRSWLRRGIADAMTCDGPSVERSEPRVEIKALRQRVALATTAGAVPRSAASSTIDAAVREAIRHD